MKIDGVFLKLELEIGCPRVLFLRVFERKSLDKIAKGGVGLAPDGGTGPLDNIEKGGMGLAPDGGTRPLRNIAKGGVGLTPGGGTRPLINIAKGGVGLTPGGGTGTFGNIAKGGMGLAPDGGTRVKGDARLGLDGGTGPFGNIEKGGMRPNPDGGTRPFENIAKGGVGLAPNGSTGPFDVDNDMNIFEIMCSLKDGVKVDVFVKHLEDEPIIVGPMFLGNVSHENMEESSVSFNNRPNFMVGEDHFNVEDPFTSFSTLSPCTTTPHFTTADSAVAPTAAPSIAAPSVAAPIATAPIAAAPNVIAPSVVAVDDIDVSPAGNDFSEEKVEGFDYSNEDSVDLERELVGDKEEKEYGSNVHEEVRELRSEKRKFQRRKRNERVPADNAKVPIGKV
ncbi:hypothetical protein T459_20081 [Capsicum annuum]|uniref:Uncharacterized protein n=1 Tax=Capsicum annuum TaxID=4072 RepID=A0A2G2Z3K4_CAPAN|nr:hypothetical protein T459_20081 [Capsicum annuum]